MSVKLEQLSHYTHWDDTTRVIPILAFLEKYSNKIDSLDLSGPFHAFYSPSCVFHNTNGAVYCGGDIIWAWMKTLFQPFAAVQHNIKAIRLFDPTFVEAPPARQAGWVLLETETIFTLKGEKAEGPPIHVPRLLMFLVGKSEVDGQGTDGMQILETKIWWDTGKLQSEVATRKQNAAQGLPM